MKKAVGIVVSMLVVVFLQPYTAQANDQKVIAIIDTAMDSNKNASVIHEVCITTLTVNDPARYCPNGTQFQEGKGAANVRDWTISGIDHGFNIAQVATNIDPNVKIVFIRISEITSARTIHNHGKSLANAVKWVSDNASRFSTGVIYKTTNSGPGMDATFLGEAKVVNYRGSLITIHGTSVASPGYAANVLKSR